LLINDQQLYQQSIYLMVYKEGITSRKKYCSVHFYFGL